MKTEQRNLSYKPMEEFKWNRKKVSTEEREEQRVELFANKYQCGTHYYY